MYTIVYHLFRVAVAPIPELNSGKTPYQIFFRKSKKLPHSMFCNIHRYMENNLLHNNSSKLYLKYITYILFQI